MYSRSCALVQEQKRERHKMDRYLENVVVSHFLSENAFSLGQDDRDTNEDREPCRQVLAPRGLLLVSSMNTHTHTHTSKVETDIIRTEDQQCDFPLLPGPLLVSDNKGEQR